MDRLSIYFIILVFSVFVASLSQVLLKKSAQKVYEKKIDEYLNTPVVIAYSMFFLTTVLNLIALKHVSVSLVPIIESMGYIFVVVLGRVLLEEKINLKKLLGIIAILTGIYIFSI